MRTRIYAYAGARSTYARRSGNRRGDVHRALLQHDNIDVHQKSHLNEALRERRIPARRDYLYRHPGAPHREHDLAPIGQEQRAIRPIGETYAGRPSS